MADPNTYYGEGWYRGTFFLENDVKSAMGYCRSLDDFAAFIADEKKKIETETGELASFITCSASIVCAENVMALEIAYIAGIIDTIDYDKDTMMDLDAIVLDHIVQAGNPPYGFYKDATIVSQYRERLLDTGIANDIETYFQGVPANDILI